MAAAELEGLVISGKRKGKEHSYALLEERVKNRKKFNREEALSELAKIYFTSHGPATIKDFQWWSGLNQTDCKKGIAANEKKLQQIDINGNSYYFSLEVKSKPENSLHLLPAFDEFLIAYKDRSPSVDPLHQKHTFTMNGIFKPILVVDGQVCGIWKRSVKKETVFIEVDMIIKIPKSRHKEVEKQAERFGDFLGLKTEVKIG
ncbi:MAG: winged helix DNA-binding domain-containing protein [Flavobacterium sp.]|nr:MAG: winged helix DNA-binding domain-containing protein [Flavobacterium sp.]